MEALHSMRPLTQTQGPFELTGPSPLAPYMTVKYNPHDEVRSHRRRSPSWTLPPNRSDTGIVIYTLYHTHSNALMHCSAMFPQSYHPSLGMIPKLQLMHDPL